MELRGWMNGRWRGGFGLWADFRYGFQLKGTTERRVFDPGFTFTPLSSQVKLDWNPGDYRFLELAPWYRVAESMTLLAGYRYHRKGPDTFSARRRRRHGARASGNRAGSRDPGAASAKRPPGRLMVGMVYNRATPTWDGSTGRPLEMRLVYRQVVGGRGGNVPNAGSLEVGFRFFAGVMGRGVTHWRQDPGRQSLAAPQQLQRMIE